MPTMKLSGVHCTLDSEEWAQTIIVPVQNILYWTPVQNKVYDGQWRTMVAILGTKPLFIQDEPAAFEAAYERANHPTRHNRFQRA